MEEYITKLITQKMSKIWGFQVKPCSPDKLRRIVEQAENIKTILNKGINGDEKSN